jgi:hypothetical protein
MTAIEAIQARRYSGNVSPLLKRTDGALVALP